MGMPNITDLCQKYVTIATYLEELKKKIRLIMPTQMSTNPENVIKISPLHSQIIGQTINKVTIADHTALQ